MDRRSDSANDDEDIDVGASPRPHLISVDELRAAGALEVPPEWRKSLGGERPRPSGRFRDQNLFAAGEDERPADSED
ncbi:MAG: hypothetical protein KF774_03470 [Planctomyces sp.]|nr:hypothetical protein [Planctomyces sp.]